MPTGLFLLYIQWLYHGKHMSVLEKQHPETSSLSGSAIIILVTVVYLLILLLALVI